MSILKFIEKHSLSEVGYVPPFTVPATASPQIPADCPIKLTLQAEVRIYANEDHTTWLFLDETEKQVKIVYTDLLKAASAWVRFIR